MRIYNKPIGTGRAWLCGDIGINHQSDPKLAHALIDAAHNAGFDAVKFQKRTPELVVPRAQWDTIRATPFGDMSTIEYRRKMELSRETYAALRMHAHRFGLAFGASAWDLESVGFLEAVGVDYHKVPSACFDNTELLQAMVLTGKPVIVSTGMCTWRDLDCLWERLPREWDESNIAILQCTSGYPVEHEHIALPVINEIRKRYGVVVGYSGHESDIEPSVLSVTAYGAAIVERHITLSRALPGSDHGASLEPTGMRALAERIRTSEALMLASGEKVVQPCERAQAKRLGRVTE